MPKLVCWVSLTEDGRTVTAISNSVKGAGQVCKESGINSPTITGDFEYSYLASDGCVMGRRPIGPQKAAGRTKRKI